MANNTELNLDEIKSVNLLSKNKVIKRICIENDVAWESPEDEVTETCTVILKRVDANRREKAIPPNTYKFATYSYHGESLSPKIHVTDPIIVESSSSDVYSITFENVAIGYVGGIFNSVNEKYIMNNAAGLFYKDYLTYADPNRPWTYNNPNFTSAYCPNKSTTNGVANSNYSLVFIDGDYVDKDIIFYGTMIDTGYIGDRYSYYPPLYGYGDIPGYSDDENRKACFGIFTRDSEVDPYVPFKLDKNHTYEFRVVINSQKFNYPLSTSFVPEMYVPSNT